MKPPRLDRNRTVYQRLRDQITEALTHGPDVDHITRVLHPYVIAERHDAKGTRHGV